MKKETNIYVINTGVSWWLEVIVVEAKTKEDAIRIWKLNNKIWNIDTKYWDIIEYNIKGKNDIISIHWYNYER